MNPRHSRDIRSLLAPVAALLAGLALTFQPTAAQTVDEKKPVPESAVSPTKADEKTPDQTVQMAAFEVRSTAGQGYAATNGATAMKTNQSLLNTPQNVLVVTNDLITDVNSENSTGVLKYAGVVPFYQGESMEMRGSRATNPYVDGMADTAPYADNINVDSYEVIKGATSVLYPQASLAGIVIKITKKPLPFQQDLVSFTANQWGAYRATFDSTGPLGKLGAGQFSYRVTGAYQGGDQYFQNYRNDKLAIHPTFAFSYKNTDLMVAYDYQHVYSTYGPQGVITPDGQVYTGWGRDGSGVPKANNEHRYHTGLRAILKQQFSEDWSMRLQLSTWVIDYGGSIVSPSAVNYSTMTENFTAVREHVYGVAWILGGDFNGKYSLGPIANESTFGFTTNNTTSRNSNWTSSAYTFQTVPLTMAGINSLYVPSQAEFPVPANPGTRSVNQSSNIYFQQQADVIPNWLTLVVGFSFADIENVQDTNVSAAAPYAATDTASHEYLHRFGGVFHITKEISLYGLESTSFNPGAGYDYYNRPLPNIHGKSDEIGLKTDLFNGKIGLSVAAYNMALTNQRVVVSGLNVVGQIYSANIGSTRSRGWEGSVVLNPLPGLQLIATGYRGTVRTQANLPLSLTYTNSWSLFGRYDFPKHGALRGLSIGGGASRVGGYYLTSSGMTLPGGATPPSLIKLHEGTGVDAFVEYQATKHLSLRLNGVNLLDQLYPTGVETIAYIDPSMPRTFSLTASYKF